MKSKNVFVSQLQTFLLGIVLLTLIAPSSVLPQESSNILDSVALSNKSKTRKSNIITDLTQDDVKVSIIDYQKNQLMLRVWKGSEVLGIAEVFNAENSQRTTFTTSFGVFFSLVVNRVPKSSRKTLPAPGSEVPSSQRNNYTVSLRTLNDSVTLNLLQFQGEAEISASKREKLQKILTEATLNKDISQLMQATRDFTSKDNFATDLMYEMYEGDSAFACGKATGSCVLSAIAWVGSVAALDAACPATFGLTCAGGLIAFGVLGGYAALDCADAINTCSNRPRPMLD